MHISFKTRWRIMISAIACLILIVGVAHAQEGGLYDSVLVQDASPDTAIDWINMLYDRVMADGVNAPAAARLYAYATISLYESALPGMPDNNTLIGQIQHLTDLPWPTENALHDWPAVMDATLQTVLNSLFSDSPDSQQAFTDLLEQHLDARVTASSQEIVDRSVEFGKTLGQALLDWISEDGYADRVTEYTPATDDPSAWVFTNPDQEPVEPGWGAIRPLILESADVCDVPNNVPFSTEEDSVFYTQAMEVMTVGENLTQEQRDIAEFWIDTPGESGTPAGHWMHIVEDLIRQEDLALNRAVELYVMNGMALMDSFIAAWRYKYAFPLIRPISYIREYINPRWQTYLETPSFPEYPSGHSVVSAAEAAVLTSYFGGPRAFSDENITPSGMATRSFTSFWAAASESAISRLYGGIHYRAAIENGLEMGRCIGNYVTSRIRLNPIRQGE